MYKFDDIEERIDKFLESLPCQSEISFPEVKVENKNLAYADMLLDAYASSADSEIQAITQYIYHSKTIGNKTISNALMCTALIEMGHLDALSEIISELGGKPAYYNSNRNFWMTGNIAYGDKNILNLKADENAFTDKHTIRSKLENDIIGEISAINGYKLLLSKIKDKYIQRVIEKIISDEEVHISIFQELIKRYLA